MNKRLNLLIYHYQPVDENPMLPRASELTPEAPESSAQPRFCTAPQVLDLGINTFYLFRGCAALFEDIDDLSKSELSALHREVLQQGQEPWICCATALMNDHLLLEDHEWGPFADAARELMKQLGSEARAELKVLLEKLIEIRPCNVVLSSAQQDHPKIFNYSLQKSALQKLIDEEHHEIVDYIPWLSKLRSKRQQRWVPFDELKTSCQRLS